jgi:hypothetical protein
MKAPGVSVIDFGLLHVDPPVLTSGALRDWRLRLSWGERLWDAGTLLVATSQLVDGD